MAHIRKPCSAAPLMRNLKDENNENNKINKLKTIGINNGNNKRTALSNLQNRGDVSSVAIKDSEKVPKNTKLQYGKIKSCLDQFGKKPVMPASSTVISGSQKFLTKSNSLRQIVEKRTDGSMCKFPIPNEIASFQKQNKFSTAKPTENKIQQVKYLNKNLCKEKANILELESPPGKGYDESSSVVQKPLSKLESTLLPEKKTSHYKKDFVLGALATKKDSYKPIDSIKLLVKSDKENNESLKNNYKAELLTSNPFVVTHSSKMLETVENIDSSDGDNLLLVSDYVNDIYNYLYFLENEFPIRQDHLKNQIDVFPKMRAVLMDWINEVHLQFHLTIETYQMAIGIIDRYLQNTLDTARKNLQLVGVTALFIAAKYEELFPPLISDFVYITDDTYTTKQILQMELKIFKALDCNLSRPLPIHFLRRFSKAAKAEDRHHTMSKYFLELSSIEYEFASHKPSEIAATSLFLSLHLLQKTAEFSTGYNDELWTPTLRCYTKYSASDLLPTCKKLAAVARNARNAKLKAVFMKYQSSKFDKISLHPILYSPYIDSLINIIKN